MRSRLRWALPALLAFLCLAPSLRAADDVKEPEAKDEKLSPSLQLDYGTLSDVSEVEPNNTPAQANLLGCGNTFRPAAIAVQAVRDTDWIAFTANAGDVITFGTDADGISPIGDTRVSILLNDGVTVLGTDDDSGPGRYSLLSICAPYTGTYYGRIAAFSSQTGPYMAFMVCSPSNAPNDQCAGAIRIPCGSIALSGNTSGACPDYTLPGTGCTGFAANGRDVVYKVVAFTGDSLYLDYVQDVADASIYIVTDCSDPAGTCVAGEDSTLVGGHETLSYTFPSSGTYYVILDSYSPGGGGSWTVNGVLACAPDQIDSLASAHANLELGGPWGVETIALNGSMTLASTLHALQVGFSGAEQVPTELTQLEFTGNSLNAGPVTVRLRAASAHPFHRSAGAIAEMLNSTPGVLDLPPFAPGGTAFAQIGTYVEVEMPVLKLLLHNDSNMQLYGTLTHLPPGVGDSLSSAPSFPLADPNDAPTSYYVQRIRLTPNPETETDTLTNPRMIVDLQGPLGLDTVTLKGTAVVKAKIGNLSDSDGDGLEQLGIEVPVMELSGFSARYGPIHASLSAPTPHPLPATTGEIEENANTQTGRLDLPPFAGSGTASSNFDLFFRLEIGNILYHNHVAKHMIGTLTQLPPAAGEQYRNFVPTPLINDNDAPSPYTARRMFFTPYDAKPTGTQRDSFPSSRLVLDVTGPWGFDQLVMTGRADTEVDLGSLADGDVDLLEQVASRLALSTLTSPGGALGHIPGPVTLRLADSVAFGEIEERTNYTPGLLDVAPYIPGGSASSFFDANFEIEIPGYPPLHGLEAAHLADTVSRVPTGPTDVYRAEAPVALGDSLGAPSGIVITGAHLTLIGYSGNVAVLDSPPLPDALAIREIRPNPTSGSATVTLALPRRTSARLAAYDVNGRLVRTLWSGEMEAGMRTVTWDGLSDRGARVPGGVYFLRFESGTQRSVRRLAILR